MFTFALVLQIIIAYISLKTGSNFEQFRWYLATIQRRNVQKFPSSQTYCHI